MSAKSIPRVYRFPLAVLCAFLLFACAPKPDPEPVWRFQPGSIHIRYAADAMLNSYNGSAHTLVMAVYQLANRETFTELAKSGEGLQILLEVRRFDQNVVGLDRFIVQPGEEKTLMINRAEDARWVGIALGYYDLRPEQATRVFGIDHTIETSGRFRKTKTAVVKPLIIDLSLGPGTVHTIGALP
ncbi:MAG: type VI secretion system lipoprotein TssJ [Candidatus Latescibacterota bacterium]